MSHENLPPELVAFFENAGKTLLIKGQPGCGKTLLALEILNRFQDHDLVYVSTRVPVEWLKRQYPWMEKARIVEADRLRLEDAQLGTMEYLMEQIIGSLHGLEKPLIVLDSWDAVANRVASGERLKAESALMSMIYASNGKAIFVAEEAVETTLDYLVDGIVTLTRSMVAGGGE